MYIFIHVCIVETLQRLSSASPSAFFILLIFLSCIFEVIISLHFYLLFPVFKPSHVFFALLKIVSSFSPILFHTYDAHVCIHLHIPKYNLLNLYTIILMCMFFWLIIEYWRTHQWAVLWGRLFLPLSESLYCLWFFV